MTKSKSRGPDDAENRPAERALHENDARFRSLANAAPAQLRGTAFGLFNLASGGALLLASVIAGVLWSELGASATFIAGAAFAAITITGLLAYER